MRGCREPLDLCWNDLGWPVMQIRIKDKDLFCGRFKVGSCYFALIIKRNLRSDQ